MASLHSQAPVINASNSTVAPVVNLAQPSQPLSASPTSSININHGAPQPFTTGHINQTSSLPTVPPWLPTTLKWPYLCTVIAFNVCILVLVVALHLTSRANSGLGNDHGSNAIYFTTNFLPTLVAVVYVYMVSATLDDIKRTEPYARAASPGGASVANTLFMNAGAWWNAFAQSFPNHKKYRRSSPSMLCATLAFVVGFALISPFSSTFLVSQDIVFTQSHAFEQLSISQYLPMTVTASATTFYRTIGNVLQNVTTSAWITKDYAVLPFWPKDHLERPIGAILNATGQSWTAESLVVSTELDCESLYSTGFSVGRDPDPMTNYTNDRLPKQILSFKSDSGCTVSLYIDNATAEYAIAAWLTPNTATGSYNHFYSSNCSGDDLILFVTSPYYHQGPEVVVPNPNYKVKGAICEAAYYFANATIKVSDGGGESIVLVDEDSYRRNRRRIPETFLNTKSLQSMLINSRDWNQRLWTGYGRFVLPSGPATLLAAISDFYPERMIGEVDITNNATFLKQRFLGELLRDVFDTALSSNTAMNEISGSIQSTRSRVIAVPAVAIILETLLSFNIIMLVMTVAFSRLRRRPLGLLIDPSPATAVATLLCNDGDTLRLLDGANVTNPSELFAHFGNNWVSIASDAFHFLGARPSNPLQHRSLTKRLRSRAHLPGVLNLLTVVFLIASILAILIAIIVLLILSETQGLYQTVFVYQFDFAVGGLELSAVNPASILTTLLAVLLALWWGAVDSNMRLLQPFLALAEKPVKGRDGASLSYQTSYMLWAAYRAIKRRHWILALVSCGAFYAEIFTIAMSALWSRDDGRTTFESTVPVSLEVRQVPLLRVTGINTNDYFSSSAGGRLLSDAFANQTTSWMYGASIQLALNGSEPPWSSDGWSFAPLDLRMLPAKDMQRLGDDGQDSNRRLTTVAEVQTVGIRARLECSPFDSFGNLSSWLTKHDLTNSTYWNTSVNPTSLKTGYELGKPYLNGGRVYGNLVGTVGGAQVSTTFYSLQPQLSCCQNYTTNGYHNASIGYWSANDRYSQIVFSPTTKFPFNLTVKWIRGIPREGYKTNTTTITETTVGGPSRHLIWQDIPSIQALACRPVIEMANTQVLIDTSSYRVQNYTLLSTPVPDTNAWTEGFVEHYPTNYRPNGSNDYPINMTVSYGSFFLSALMTAVDLSFLSATPRTGLPDFEYAESETYTISMPGLNMDYMSYSMYALSGSDPNALLDKDTMERTAQKTFSTFFQHYASASVFTAGTSWVFGRLDERLPADLTAVTNPGMVSPPAKPRMGETSTVRVEQPIKVLQMSRAAAGIAISAMMWLGVTAIMLACASRRYKTKFEWRVETVADVIAMLVGSTRFLTMLEQRGSEHMKHSDAAMAELSNFVPDGLATGRWGIELAKQPAVPVSVSTLSTPASGSPVLSVQSVHITPTVLPTPSSTVSATQVATPSIPAVPTNSTTNGSSQPLQQQPRIPLSSASSSISVMSSIAQPSHSHQSQSQSHTVTISITPAQTSSSGAHEVHPQPIEPSNGRPPSPESPVSPLTDDDDSLLAQEQGNIAGTYSASIPLESLTRVSPNQNTGP